MEKLLTVVVLVSSLVATLADGASSTSSLQHPSPDSLRGRVLGRKGGGEEELAYHHYRREGEHKEQHEVAPMELEVERAEERKRKAGWRDEDEDEDAVATEGLISSADYSGVAMHGHSSPPAHKKKKHPKP